MITGTPFIIDNKIYFLLFEINVLCVYNISKTKVVKCNDNNINKLIKRKIICRNDIGRNVHVCNTPFPLLQT